MNIKINVSAILGSVCAAMGAVIWTFAQGFVGTVYANDKMVLNHDQRLAVLEAIRPQVQDILVKVDSMDRAIRRDRQCNVPKQKVAGD